MHCGLLQTTACLETDRQNRQETSKDTVDLNYTVNHLDLIDIYRIFSNSRDIHSSQVHMKHSPSQNTFWFIKQTLKNFKEQRSYKVFSQTTMELEQKLITERQLEKIQICQELGSTGTQTWNKAALRRLEALFLLCVGKRVTLEREALFCQIQGRKYQGWHKIPLLFLRTVRILSYPIAEAVLVHKCNQSSLPVDSVFVNFSTPTKFIYNSKINAHSVFFP